MQTTNDQPGSNHTTDNSTDQATDRRVTVPEAAVLLGLSEDAVRSCLKRGTLRREKARDGTVLVVLGVGGSSGRPTTGTVQTISRPTTGQPTDKTVQTDLAEVLHDQMSFLREQLEQEREANRENRRIIAALTQRIPEIEPPRDSPPEPRHVPERADETASEGAAESRTGTEGPQEATEERRTSWWRRFFGFEDDGR
ncbi:MAG: hypothetical protein LC751_19680 [Actinobacteria bacterium]|nr:hypothetical protein [Actinomycetota bacterium]